MAKTNLTAERVRELLDYNPDTGVFVWKRNTRRKGTGRIAGTVDHDGYILIGIDYRSYKAHRLAWLYMHGVWPDNEIDHIDENKGNNRIANLRDIPHRGNSQNIRAALSNHSLGIRNVYIAIKGQVRKPYCVRFMVDGKLIYNMPFATLEEAAAAAAEMRPKLHPYHVGT